MKSAAPLPLGRRACRPIALAIAASLGLVWAAAAQEARDGTAAPFASPETPPLTFGLEGAANGTLSTQSRQRRLIFSVLIGAESRPTYFGSEENEVIPQFRPNVLALSYGNLRVGSEEDALDADPNDPPIGFGLGVSFRYITARKAGDYDELEGLDDVDGSLEAGLLMGYAWRNAEAFGTLRYGLTGHNTWAGELGANYVARPADKVTMRIGPRLYYGTDEFADTYFGVTPGESAASGLDAYDPDGGLVSAGVELIATYQIADQWWLEGRARWEQLQNDAADSPIVEQGTTDMGTVSIGVRRAFVLDF